MKWMLDITIPPLNPPITYKDKIMVMGSCFTEHIGKALSEYKFQVQQNPNGILFGTDSVCRSLKRYVRNEPYTEHDLFYLNEVWNSWDHHSRFSGTDKIEVLKKINAFQANAHTFLKQAQWVIVTLGSSFSYRLMESVVPQQSMLGLKEGYPVANCHRAPQQWFDKDMMTIEEMIALLDNTYHQLRIFNPSIKFIFTISPVRHIRDGVVENNLSKARLLEAVHHIVNKFEGAYYFPAYELVIDVLRDYRFYDVDLIHPNYAATEYVLEKFIGACIEQAAHPVMEEVRKIVLALSHKPFFPETQAHKQFVEVIKAKITALEQQHPYLDLQAEKTFFNN